MRSRHSYLSTTCSSSRVAMLGTAPPPVKWWTLCPTLPPAHAAAKRRRHQTGGTGGCIPPKPTTAVNQGLRPSGPDREASLAFRGQLTPRARKMVEGFARRGDRPGHIAAVVHPVDSHHRRAPIDEAVRCSGRDPGGLPGFEVEVLVANLRGRLSLEDEDGLVDVV